MIGKMQAARQPSINELLDSIRQAIHERVEPDTPAEAAALAPAGSPDYPEIGAKNATSVKRLEPATRTADTGRLKPSMAGAGGLEGFAGLLGGDVRLEEALARLNHTTRGDAGDQGGPATARGGAAGDAALPAGPKLRPAIDDWTGSPASPAAPQPLPVAPVRPIRPIAPANHPTTPPIAPSTWTGRQPSGAELAPPRRREPAPEPALTVGPMPDAGKARDERKEESPIVDRQPSRPRPTERPARTVAGSDHLLSSQAASAANAAFSRLVDSVASRSSGNDRRLDEMTRECLRPLLKGWLEENLPGLVERLVREEIERVARRGR